ncbi:Degenerin unc-8 [Stylophora pistillata]|uniref:Degenerin unc-8 n=1 Tax=Stylophora pistillata TaxID=50429 RepID=A0A2B4T2E6_STYPI|nr:Degenerin unc-8 [Stylophora pistillata]
MLACLAELNKTFLAKLGHQFKDLVRSCTFRGIPCRYAGANDRSGSSSDDTMEDASLWTHFWHFKFGNCFVFNLGGKQKSSVLHQTKPGISQGLMLEMNIQQQEYLDTTSGAGVRVDISDQGQMPFPLESGVSLAPGFSTMIGLKKTIFERIDPANDVSCIFGKQLSFDGNGDECAESCVPPCRSVQLKKSTSLEVWPSEKYKETDSEFKFSEEDFDSKNNLRLHVFYQELEEEIIKEAISYTIDGFISDIGGQLGLWVGVSVLTLAEFLELITTLCRFAFKKYTKRNEVVVTPKT